MDVVIVGAGPTGLTAGVELVRHGVKVDIIDKKQSASTLSRAVGINPHSLYLLEASGVTRQLLEKGIKYQQAHFYHGQKLWATLQLGAASPKQYGYDFMLGLPQNETEAILRDTLVHLGGKIHYETELTDISNEEHRVIAKTSTGKSFFCDYLIGADGAHSTTRQLLNIDCKGLELPEAWSIADIDATNLEDSIESVSIYSVGRGKLVFIAPIGENRYRLVSNTEDAIKYMPFKLDIAKIHREGKFKINIAQVNTYQKGRVFLAGDAAHVHSPAGGRGMNLGIADAADLTDKLIKGELDGYTKSRYREGKKIIAGSEVLRKILTVPNPFIYYFMLIGLKLVTSVPFLQKRVARKFLYG